MDGVCFNIQRFSTHDGPGIRTTVFVKGCPLRCLWCHNPESNLSGRQMIHYAHLCTACGACVAACPRGLISFRDGQIVTDRRACDNCGKCAEVCPSDAREMVGSRLTVQDVMQEIEKDALYYRHSGGGVTISGGEPLAQSGFVAEILRACHAQNIHTAMETCGYAPWEKARIALETVDLVLYDIKHMSNERHIALTGVSNTLILDNLIRTAEELEKPIWIRLPLIAGVNDDVENQEALIEFLTPIRSHIDAVWLLPFHRLGISKLEALGLSTERQESFAPPSEERLTEMLDRFTQAGFTAKRG